MEELGDSNLPSHLEIRQEDLEKDFEKLMKRCSFVRKVVEQYLVINDIASQFKKLRAEGEKIKLSMTHSADTSSNTQQENNSFDERVQSFKDNSSNWVTTLVKRIPYPEIDTDVDGESNTNANSRIAKCMDGYAVYLAEITEELEVLLYSHRENLSNNVLVLLMMIYYVLPLGLRKDYVLCKSLTVLFWIKKMSSHFRMKLLFDLKRNMMVLLFDWNSWKSVIWKNH
jgi:hypothetical protein